MQQETAQKLLPIVNNPLTWEPVQAYLQEQIQWTHRALVVATLESEIRQLQGKAILLDQLLHLKDQIKSSLDSHNMDKQENDK